MKTKKLHNLSKKKAKVEAIKVAKKVERKEKMPTIETSEDEIELNYII